MNEVSHGLNVVAFYHSQRFDGSFHLHQSCSLKWPSWSVNFISLVTPPVLGFRRRSHKQPTHVLYMGVSYSRLPADGMLNPYPINQFHQSCWDISLEWDVHEIQLHGMFVSAMPIHAVSITSGAVGFIERKPGRSLTVNGPRGFL